MAVIRLPRPKSKKVLADPTQSKRIDDAYLKALTRLLNKYRDAVTSVIEEHWPVTRENSRELEVSAGSMIALAKKAGLDAMAPDDMETVSAEFVKKGYLQGITFADLNLSQIGIELQIGMGPADKKSPGCA